MLYTAESLLDSEDQLHSFTNQIRYYSTYVQGHPEYTLVDIYADEGITGTSMERRDEMNRLLNDCKGGRIDRILTKSVSRFARNTEELLLSVRMLKEIGVSVYFEEQGIRHGKANCRNAFNHARRGRAAGVDLHLGKYALELP